MRIEILGTGCPKCIKTLELVEQVVSSVQIQAEILKVKDLDKIMNYGVMMTPALAIDGEVKCAGRVPKLEEIIEWIIP